MEEKSRKCRVDAFLVGTERKEDMVRKCAGSGSEEVDKGAAPPNKKLRQGKLETMLEGYASNDCEDSDARESEETDTNEDVDSKSNVLRREYANEPSTIPMMGIDETTDMPRPEVSDAQLSNVL